MKYLKTYEEVTITFKDNNFVDIVQYACRNNNIKLIKYIVETDIRLDNTHLEWIIPTLIEKQSYDSDQVYKDKVKILNYIIDNKVNSVNDLEEYIINNVFSLSDKESRYKLLELFINKGLIVKDKNYLKRELLNNFPFINVIKILVENGAIVNNKHIYRIFSHYNQTQATNQAIEIIKYLLENFDISNIKDFEEKVNYNTWKKVNVYDVIEETKKKTQKYNKLINILKINFPDFYDEINIRASTKKYNL